MADKNIKAIYPLTPLQEGILYHVIQSTESRVYFNQFTCRLLGDLHIESYKQAWAHVFSRHDALRTLFTWEKRERPLQIVRSHVDVPLETIDWRGRRDSEIGAGIEDLLNQDRETDFNLQVAPLARIRVVATGLNDARLIVSFHHIILDGWSLRILINESLEVYRTLREGAQVDLPPAPIFEKFVIWQQHRDSQKDEHFWRARLAGFKETTSPTIVIPDKREGHPGQQTEMQVGTELTENVQRLARRQGVTVNTVFVAAWSLLLARYCDTRDVVFGTTVSGRASGIQDVDKMVGLLINTLPVRITFTSNMSLGDLLKKVQNQQVLQQDYEHTSLQQIRRWSDMEASAPLFETIMVFENLPDAAPDASSGLQISEQRFIEHSNFPLALLVVPGNAINLIAVHDGRRYSRSVVTQILRAFRFVLEQLTSPAEVQLDTVSIARINEQSDVIVPETSGREAAYRGVRTIVHLFEESCARSPGSPAIADGDELITYEALNRRANQLGRHLQNTYNVQGKPVIIYADRSIDAIVAMLAVLKSGGVYIPIDVGDPGDRLERVISDLANGFSDGVTLCRPIVITQDHLTSRIQSHEVEIAQISDVDAESEFSNIDLDLQPHQLAYIIYTSGSTGRPKGVMVQHGALLNSNLARFEFYKESPASYALLSSLATDSSLAGIYWTLCSGGQLVIPGNRDELDIEILSALICSRKVSHMLCVPSLYAMILEHAEVSSLRSLRVVIVAGEACDESVVIQHRKSLPAAALYNEYGPSEACVWASATELGHEPISIGKPVLNTEMYVMDSERRPVPAGVSGEIYISGANLALGYLGDEEATQASFVEAGSTGVGKRMYRTGDRGRFQEDGNIVFLGRVDHQLKVRGFRVEPAEIESALTAREDVDAAVVFTSNTTTGSRLLAAIVGDVQDFAEVKSYCERLLPQYMVPQKFVKLPELPRTNAGKIDRQGLAERDWLSEEVQGSPIVAPRSPSEEKLAAIWRDAMNLDEVSVFDNFFEVGGDSLLMIRVLSRAAKEGLRIKPELFFRNPTIAEQASLAEEGFTGPVREVNAGGTLPLLPIQRWFFEHIRTDAHHWNHSYLFEIDSAIESSLLIAAIERLLRQHVALKTRFQRKSDEWTAEIVDRVKAPVIRVVDLSELPSESDGVQIENVARQLNAEFNLAAAPLLKAGHFVNGRDGRSYLLLVVHHLVIDVESWRILTEDLNDLLERGDEARNEPGSRHWTSISVWARKLADWADDPGIESDLCYWQERLRSESIQIPIDFERIGAKNLERDAAVESFTLENDPTARLLQTATEKLRASPYHIVLSAFSRVIALWTGIQRVVIETEGHGREALFEGVDVSRTVGWMTSTYPLIFDASTIDVWGDASAALRLVKETVRTIPHNGITYGILRELAHEEERSAVVREFAGSPVLFNFLGHTDFSDSDARSLRLLNTRCGPARSENCERAYLIEVNASISSGELILEFRYNKNFHSNGTITRLGDQTIQNVRALLATADRACEQATVASDFPLADLDEKELQNIASQLDIVDEQ